MINLPMLKWGFGRLVTGATLDLRKVADDSWELCGEESETIPPARFLPGETEKIRGLSPWRNWETEKLLIEGGGISHAPTTCYLLRKVDLVGGYLYRGRAKLQSGYGSESVFFNNTKGSRLIEESAHLVSSWAGSYFFGNRMLDGYPLYLAPPENSRLVCQQTRDYPHDEEYRALLSLPKASTIAKAQIEELVIYADFAQNSFKKTRYDELRARIRSKLGHKERGIGKRVYIKRGPTGEPRILSNEDEVVRKLSAEGFAILDPVNMTSAEIARRSMDAQVVVAVEGSHLSHAIYTLAENGAIVTIQPPRRFALPYKEFADRMNMPFAFLVGDCQGAGFRIDVNDLLRLLELVQ